MHRDLRVKLRNRHSRISSCSIRDFLPLTKQFFAFINDNPVVKGIIAELLARNQESANEAQTANPNSQVYGVTAEEAATIGYVKWQTFSTQNDPESFLESVLISNNRTGLDTYRDWYVEPLFDYLDEILEDGNVILATLTRYKHKVEWYRRSEVRALYEGDNAHGEKRVARHMYEFLFDQGLPFHVEPTSASGKPDVVSVEGFGAFIGDVKIFDAGGRGPGYIKKGFYQVYRYCLDYNEPLGHLIVFNVSKKQLRVELPSAPDGVPRFEYNHKTIFLTVIDVHEREGAASTQGIADTITISAAELVHEVEAEALQAGA